MISVTEELVGVSEVSHGGHFALEADKQKQGDYQTGKDHYQPHAPVSLEGKPSFEEHSFELEPK